MRNSLRVLSISLAAVGLLSCSDMTGRTAPSAHRTFLSIAPRFDLGATQAATALAQAGLSFDHVRVFVVRPPSATVADTTIAYLPSDTATTLVLSVLAVPNDSLIVTMQYKAGATVLFEGSSSTRAIPLNTPVTAANTISISVTYTGPGATATSVSVSPSSVSITSGATTQFSARAFDASNVELLNVPFVWSVDDPDVATIDATTGVLTPHVARGTVLVTATLPGVHGSASITLAPPATGLHVVQGAAQAGTPGSQLPIPVVIELVASDGLPGLASGLTATFTANSGGSASPASVALDANGRAQTLLTLGPTAGNVYLYTVTAGSFSVIVPEVAIVGTPTQLIPNGATSFTVTAGTLPNPIPTFRVADAQGNSVPLFPLKAVATSGTKKDSLTFVADTIGVGDLSKLTLTVAGTYTVAISSANSDVTFPTLTYTITVVPAAASKLAFGTQPPTTAATNAPFTVSVLIQDQFGNTVTSAAVAVTIGLDPATTAGMTLNGTKTVSPASGVATFTNLSMTPGPRTGVRLTATAGTLTPVTSNAFAINP